MGGGGGRGVATTVAFPSHVKYVRRDGLCPMLSLQSTPDDMKTITKNSTSSALEFTVPFS